jgi:hypothetical protein
VVVTTIGPGLTEAISKAIEAEEEMAAMEEVEAEATEVVEEAAAQAVAEEDSPTSPCHLVCFQVNQFHWS